MTQQGDNQHHHVPTGRIKRIQPRQHTGLFSAHDLRGDLSKLTRKISPRRQLAAVIPLVVALIGWFVVPSFAATYQFTGSGRQYGISESTNGGLGAFEIWDGTGWQTAGSTSYKLLGNFLLHGSDGTSVPAYCISLEDQHYVNDVLTPGAEGPSRSIPYCASGTSDSPIPRGSKEITGTDAGSAEIRGRYTCRAEPSPGMHTIGSASGFPSHTEHASVIRSSVMTRRVRDGAAS